MQRLGRDRLVDDIHCRMQALSHLKGLQDALGDERFKSSYPELEDLGEKLTERIKDHEANIQELMTEYGLPMLKGIELIEGTKEEE